LKSIVFPVQIVDVLLQKQVVNPYAPDYVAVLNGLVSDVLVSNDQQVPVQLFLVAQGNRSALKSAVRFLPFGKLQIARHVAPLAIAQNQSVAGMGLGGEGLA